MRAFATRLGFLAAMMFVIALLAPAQASAHAGHEHAAPVQTVDVEAAVEAAVEVILSAAESNIDARTICPGGCCSGASHACCSVVALVRSHEGWPAVARQRVFSGASFALLDHTPSARGKPPRFLA